jgi:hypothetical protein
MKLDQEQQYAVSVCDAIENLFRGEEKQVPLTEYDLSTVDATAFFTGALIGLNVFFEHATQKQMDLIDFTHTLNKLAFQYLRNKANSAEMNPEG